MNIKVLVFNSGTYGRRSLSKMSEKQLWSLYLKDNETGMGQIQCYDLDEFSEAFNDEEVSDQDWLYFVNLDNILLNHEAVAYTGKALMEAKVTMQEAIMNYVRLHGEDFSEQPLSSYYVDEFGIDDEENGDKVVKILNLFDNGGCYFAVQNEVNDEDIRKNWNEQDFENAGWWGFSYHAFWAFYIVRGKDGEESLKYYQFHNPGIVWSDEESEPDHDKVENLSLVEFRYIIEAIEKLKM